MNIGKKVKQLRVEHNLTQSEFAKKLGVAPTTISGYELNTRKPDYETLIAIADLFEVSLDDLLGRKRKLFTTNEITDLIDDDIKGFVDQEKIEFVEFYKKVKKEKVPIEDLNEMLRFIKNIRENTTKKGK